MEDRKISLLEEHSAQTYVDMSPQIYIPIIVNEGSGWVNKRLNLKSALDLLRSNIVTSGGSGSSGGTVSGDVLSKLDTLTTKVGSLESSVEFLRSPDAFPTHQIVIVDANDASNTQYYQLPCHFGASRQSFTIYSNGMDKPLFKVTFSLNQPTFNFSWDGNVGTLTMGFSVTLLGHNGTGASGAYLGGNITSIYCDIYYRDSNGNLGEVERGHLIDLNLTVPAGGELPRMDRSFTKQSGDLRAVNQVIVQLYINERSIVEPITMMVNVGGSTLVYGTYI